MKVTLNSFFNMLFDDRPIQGFSSVGVPHSCKNLMEDK
jgi:hypothetical protein